MISNSVRSVVVVRLDNGSRGLYEAEPYILDENDEVIVEGYGEDVEKGIVIAEFCKGKESDDIYKLTNIFSTCEPLKRVIAKVEYVRLKYKEES